MSYMIETDVSVSVLHPQKLKDGDRGAEIGNFEDILKTYTDLEAYWDIPNDS